MTLPSVTIYTDGGCVPNPGRGGWSAIVIAGDGSTQELSGSDPATTNNRMELTAAVEGLRALKQPSRVRFVTDSEYVKNGITKWLATWIVKGWRTREGPVKNQDLWQALDTERQRHEIKWEWVRGHTGNPHNERVDQLATAAREGRPPTPAPLPTRQPAASSSYEVVLRVAAAKSRQGGGYAIRIADPKTSGPLTHSGRADTASPPRLELLAAVDALRRVPSGAAVRVYCPDEYLYKGVTGWIRGWQKNNWMTASGTPVKHQDLWQALIEEAGKRSVEWQPEKGPHPLALDLEQAAEEAANG